MIGRLQRPTFCLAAVLIALMAGCVAPSPLTTTPGSHSVLHSHLTSEEALELQQESERTLKGVCDYLCVAMPETPAEIMLFDSRRDLKHHFAEACPIMTNAAAACYERTDGTLVVALRRHRNPNETLRLLRHELSHYVIASHFEDIPPWVDEGLAQCFEAGEPYGQDNPRNRTIAERQLRKGQKNTVAELVAIPPGTRLGRKQYALAWGLTRYLSFQQAGTKAPVRGYLETVHSGADPIAQFTQRFGLSPAEAGAKLLADLTSDSPEQIRFPE